MVEGHEFSGDSARRIAAAVLWTEAQRRLAKRAAPGVERRGLPPFQFRWFELVEPLHRGSSATALRRAAVDGEPLDTLDADEGSFTVYDTLGMFSLPPIAQGDGGALGIAIHAHDEDRWDIIAMQQPAPFWGELAADLDYSSASVEVRALATLGGGWGYLPFGVNANNRTTAYNPTCQPGGPIPGWFAGNSGDTCLCAYDVDSERYWLVAVQPNERQYQTLDVVVDATANFDAKTLTLFRKTLRLPPWVTISTPP